MNNWHAVQLLLLHSRLLRRRLLLLRLWLILPELP
jgi:hypothetical protein